MLWVYPNNTGVNSLMNKERKSQKKTQFQNSLKRAQIRHIGVLKPQVFWSMLKNTLDVQQLVLFLLKMMVEGDLLDLILKELCSGMKIWQHLITKMFNSQDLVSISWETQDGTILMNFTLKTSELVIKLDVIITNYANLIKMFLDISVNPIMLERDVTMIILVTAIAGKLVS